MNIDEALRTQLLVTFRPLNTVAASKAFPSPTSLSKILEQLIPNEKNGSVAIQPKHASHFATAAVEIWHRGVHSFLVSVSLTDASPIWAAVSGYYSSHYCVRAIAHLLGYFQLFRKKQIVQLKLAGNSQICDFKQKGTGNGEHQIYWRLVKQNIVFVSDPVFSENKADIDTSDVGRRNRANYADHICDYPVFHAMDTNSLKDRIERISKIVVDSAPSPNPSKVLDNEYVQLIAYHRIIRFRKILDEVLGNSNRFWNVHRTPSFASRFMDFQVVERETPLQSQP